MSPDFCILQLTKSLAHCEESPCVPASTKNHHLECWGQQDLQSYHLCVRIFWLGNLEKPIF